MPPIWGGLTAKGVTPPVTQAETEHLPNQPFAADDPKGFNLSLGTMTADLIHRFYQNQMQIDDGSNNKFVAWGDTGALVMGYWDGSEMPMWAVAKQYTLADNFFMSGFGGSFYNHIRLICACTPYFPHADTSPAKPTIAVVNPDGVSLKVAANSPKSAMDGIPKFVSDGNLTPDFYAVNTMQPPYQPSKNQPPKGGDRPTPTRPSRRRCHRRPIPRSATCSAPRVSPGPITAAPGRKCSTHGNATPTPAFQSHHQPFNYYANYAPGTAARAEHLRDGGLGGVEFIKAIDTGKLPAVAFYKPQGNLNQHSGYADIASGDHHIADLIHHLEHSPQWGHMLVVVTYDENGGLWDHVTPPKGDRWGPGTRIPAIIVSPYAKRDNVDHTPYDTNSILRFIIHRFDLPNLDGIRTRDAAMAARGQQPLGDLSASLNLL